MATHPPEEALLAGVKASHVNIPHQCYEKAHQKSPTATKATALIIGRMEEVSYNPVKSLRNNA
jgi:hypothetical protein